MGGGDNSSSLSVEGDITKLVWKFYSVNALKVIKENQ